MTRIPGANMGRPPLAGAAGCFRGTRIANLVLIKRTPEALWDGLGHHEERVPPAFAS